MHRAWSVLSGGLGTLYREQRRAWSRVLHGPQDIYADSWDVSFLHWAMGFFSCLTEGLDPNYST